MQRHQIPHTAWIDKRGTERWLEYWRPFSGELKGFSQQTALTILQALYQGLTERHFAWQSM
jgi:hypothetical protein